MTDTNHMQYIQQAKQILDERLKQQDVKSYPHTTYVLSWLSGRTVQYWEDGIWKDMPSPAIADKVPHFYRNGLYRYKPVTVRFRVGQSKDGSLVFAFSLKEEKEAEDRGVTWTSYWHEFTGDLS